MIIDQNAIDNLDFSIINDEESNTNDSVNDISTIIHKYSIVCDTNYLIDSEESNYIFLISHISDLYYLDQDIPTDIAEILKSDIKFKTFLLHDLKRKLKNIMINNSTLFFKEISNIVNLLSLGTTYKIFETYTKYNLDELSRFFRDYEAFLGEQSKNSELFDITFKCYVILIETFTQLCIINSTDILRKKTITSVIDRLTETNNMLKFTVTLSEENLNELNNILGKHLYYFTHIPYFQLQNKTIDYVIDEFALNLGKQTDGYHLSKNTNFGNNLKVKQKEFIKFKNNCAYLLLILIKKLEKNFQDQDFFTSKSFYKLLDIYNKEFLSTSNRSAYNSLEDFKNLLLNSLIFNYTPYCVESSKIITYVDVIDNFILSSEDFNYTNLETIHNILLLSNNIDEYKYLQVASILTDSKLLENDYYEFFYIKTLDVIVNKFVNKKSNNNINEFIYKTLQYVNKNKTASQLLSMFTKIYLSLSLFYSYDNTTKSNTEAKDLYAIFININGLDTLENEYKQINDEILINLGKSHIKDMSIQTNSYNENDLKIIGNNQINTYLQYKDIELKYKINKEISSLISQILSKDNFDYEDINYKISQFISNKLFHGIASVSIEGLTKLEPTINDTGYKQFSISILEGYKILFIFPAVYEDVFKYILNKNDEYIKQNVKNILTAYNKNNILYIDEITSLQNTKKLQNDISNISGEITLLEISIASLVYVNRKYGYDVGNNFFNAISKKIASFIQAEDGIYRLAGARIGIILYEKDSHNELIKKIFNFKIRLKEEQIEINCILAVTSGLKDNILTKSYQNVEEAKIDKKSINIKI